MPTSTTDPNLPLSHPDWSEFQRKMTIPLGVHAADVDYERIREIIREEIINALRIPKQYWELLDENTLFVPPSAKKDR